MFIRSPSRILALCSGLSCACLAWSEMASAQHAIAPDSARRTPMVNLIARCAPAVVSVRVPRPADPATGAVVIDQGSGSIIHASGIVLTNDHVVQWSPRGEVELSDGRRLPFEVLARCPPEDLALLRVSAGAPLPTLALGRSHDLLLGEPVLVIGNPNGLVNSVSTGIVSGLQRATTSPIGFLSSMVQTTAPVNGGNSGGPLINALGEQIGVIATKDPASDNIAFAISVDRVRESFPRLLSAEERYGFRLGLSVGTLTDARVLALEPDSPAQRAGILVGDRVTAIGGQAVRDGVEFQLALVDRRAGERLLVELKREGASIARELELAPFPLEEPHQAAELEAGLISEHFEGVWTALPDFDRLQPTRTELASGVQLPASATGADHFAVRLRGYLQVPEDGIYYFWLGSDDGSRLRLGSRELVNNDGLHAHHEAAQLIRLRAGLHPIEIQMFEAGGDASLSLAWLGPSFGKQAVPEGAFFRPKRETPRDR
jgi:serine protease Do